MDENRTLCPCCGAYERNFTVDLGICPVCDWEDDFVQEDDPDYEGGANLLTLNQAKKKWEERSKANDEDE